MNRKVLAITLAVLLALLLSVGGATGQEPEGEVRPQGEVSIAATVNSRISYQGILKEGGTPVTGSRDMTFRLYSNSTCSTQVGNSIARPGVTVTEGLFSLKLDVDQDDFNGQGLWLGVDVGNTGANVVCEEILPAPYALSLRPGASIISTQAGQNAIRAENTATTGYSYGVYGRSRSTQGKGVLGYASATSGTTYGVYGLSDSTDGRGVYGTGNYGVYGISWRSSGGRGVYGRATGGGINWGVFGESLSASGVGVLGANYTSSGATYGVYGYTQSAWGHAVHGESGSIAGFAGYFQGRTHVAGTLTKSAGSFKIDHPLDPENKYLHHSFVESPDMMNVYNGNITLDANGEAWVALPDWFEALNQEFRYQLTPIGAPGPNLYIAEQIQANRFKIAGGEPGLVVSWQVTGIRHDPYAEAHRIPVEETKPPEEQGTYLHPVEHGQPETMGLDYQRNQALKLSLSEAQLEEPEAPLPEEVE